MSISYVNEFTVRGIVLSVERGMYHSRIMRLLVKGRRSDSYVEISLDKSITQRVNIKDRVIVSGYARGFRYHNDALNKESNVMFLVATSIEVNNPRLKSRACNRRKHSLSSVKGPY